MQNTLQKMFLQDPLFNKIPGYKFGDEFHLVIGQPEKSGSAFGSTIVCPLYKWIDNNELDQAIIRAVMKGALEFGHYQKSELNAKAISVALANMSRPDDYIKYLPFSYQMFCIPEFKIPSMKMYEFADKHHIGIKSKTKLNNPILIMTPEPEFFGAMPMNYKSMKELICEQEIGFFFLAQNVRVIEIIE